MANVTIEQIQAKQQAMIDKAMKLVDMKDGEKILAESKKLEAEGKQLDAMCKVFEMEQKQLAIEKYGRVDPPPSKLVRVELTEEQQKKVHDETGVWMEVVELKEGSEIHEDVMPSEQPELIQYRAIQKAKGMVAEQEAEAVRKKEIGDALKALKNQNNPDLDKQLAEAAKDPDFLGGAFKK